MPIKALGGKFTLVCINHQNEHTMARLENDVAFPIVLSQTRLLRCMVFTCTICNYVELYLPSEEEKP
ncbi:MAG TPA: hypothetical protein VK571_03370 [Gemmatimonadaceae bacterium]|nr:hypothetical protein [Gemmatimonadaceae bacterium]